MTHEIGTINYDHHLQLRKLLLRSGIWQGQALKIDLFDFKTCSPYHCAILTLRTRQTACEPVTKRTNGVSCKAFCCHDTAPLPSPLTSLGVNPCWGAAQEFWCFLHPVRMWVMQTMLVKAYLPPGDSCAGDKRVQMKNRREGAFQPLRTGTSPGWYQLQKSIATQSLNENHTAHLVCWMIIWIIVLPLYIFSKILCIR